MNENRNGYNNNYNYYSNYSGGQPQQTAWVPQQGQWDPQQQNARVPQVPQNAWVPQVPQNAWYPQQDPRYAQAPMSRKKKFPKALIISLSAGLGTLLIVLVAAVVLLAGQGNRRDAEDASPQLVIEAAGTAQPEAAGDQAAAEPDTQETDTAGTNTAGTNTAGTNTAGTNTAAGITSTGTTGRTETALTAIREDLVTDAYSETFSGNYGAVTAHIPQINLDGSDAERINQEIYNDLYPLFEETRQGTGWNAIGSLDYRWYVNGDILSLVCEYENANIDGTEYTVYNFSVSTGEQLTTDEFIDALGISRDVYLAEVRQALSDKVLALWNISGSAGDYDYQMTHTLSDENLADTTPYLDENGDLRAAALVWGFVGGECYDYDLPVYAADTTDTTDTTDAIDTIDALGVDTQSGAVDLGLPQSTFSEMDSYFRQTLADTFGGSDWANDYLDSMELLGHYELAAKSGNKSDNYVYLLYRVTAHNTAAGTSKSYYWFGCYKNVSVSDSGEMTYAERSCFTNNAGEQYKLYIGSGYYYYGYGTLADFTADRITPKAGTYNYRWVEE